MISQVMKYGGISAKVRSMYGRRLKTNDFHTMMRMTSVADIAVYLKSLPGWGEVLDNTDAHEATRQTLEEAVSSAITHEYIRIYKFMSSEDHPLMEYLVLRREMEEILSFMRMLISGTPSAYSCKLPPFFKNKFKINTDRLHTCSNFDDLLDLARHSPFHRVLSRMPRDPASTPDFTGLKTAMLSEYFREIERVIRTGYSGDIALTLDKNMSIQSELLNIETIIRIKTTYPEMAESIGSLLLPKYHYIKPALLYKLLELKTADDVLGELRDSPYSKLFSSHSFVHIEDYRFRYLYDFYKKVLSSPMPSVFTPIAYIGLKEFEIKALINVIECVHYGIRPDDVSIELIIG